jgi:hypothetical protein
VGTRRSLHIIRSTRTGPGRVPSSISISAKKPSAPATASPASKTSAQCCSTGCAPCSASTAAST